MDLVLYLIEKEVVLGTSAFFTLCTFCSLFFLKFFKVFFDHSTYTTFNGKGKYISTGTYYEYATISFFMVQFISLQIIPVNDGL